MTFSDQLERVRNRDGASNARSHYRAGKTPNVCTSGLGHDRIIEMRLRVADGTITKTRKGRTTQCTPSWRRCRIHFSQAVTSMAVDVVPEHVFRPPRVYLFICVTGSIAFAVGGSVSVFVAATNIDGSFNYPIPSAVVFGLFWGAWFMASLWGTADYFRGQLSIEADVISQQGALRLKRTLVSEISKLHWRTYGGFGRVVIHCGDGRMKIDFDDLTANDRAFLIDWLHQRVPESVQENWDAFHDRQLFLSQPPQKSRSAGIVCLLAFLSLGLILILCWSIYGGPALLVTGATSVLAGLWYLVRVIRFVPDSSTTD